MTSVKDLYIPSTIKFSIISLSLSMFFYFLFVEKDIIKALVIMNFMINYRAIIFFIIDWNDEITYRDQDTTIQGLRISYMNNDKKIKKEDFSVLDNIKPPSNNNIPQPSKDLLAYQGLEFYPSASIINPTVRRAYTNDDSFTAKLYGEFLKEDSAIISGKQSWWMGEI